MSDRCASLNRSIFRSSRAFSRASAFSARRRKNQRTLGNRKCVAKLTAAKPRIRTNNQTGTATVPNMGKPYPESPSAAMPFILVQVSRGFGGWPRRRLPQRSD
jgi:hypothetical protein